MDSKFLQDTDIVQEEPPIIILDINYDVCMADNGNDTNHTRHVYRRVNFVINVDKCKINKIYWCEEGLQLADIASYNVWENYLNTRMKYIMVRLDN